MLIDVISDVEVVVSCFTRNQKIATSVGLVLADINNVIENIVRFAGEVRPVLNGWRVFWTPSWESYLGITEIRDPELQKEDYDNHYKLANMHFDIKHYDENWTEEELEAAKIDEVERLKSFCKQRFPNVRFVYGLYEDNRRGKRGKPRPAETEKGRLEGWW